MRRRSVIPFFSFIVNVLWWLSLAGLAVLAVAGVIIVAGRPWAGDGSFVLSWQSPGLGIEFAPIPGPSAANDWLVTALFFASALILVGLIAVIMYHLRAVMTVLRTGVHFSPETGRRLSLMGWVTAAAAVFAGIIRTFAAWYITMRVNAPGVTLTVRPGVDWMLLFLAFVLFVLAEVWRQGSTLQEENDLTV